MRRAALITSTAALAACSLVVDLSALSSPDASIDAAPEAALDASADTTAEAATEAGPRFCTGTHLLCEDFDDDSGSWSDAVQPTANNVTLTVVTNDSTSKPASLRIVPLGAGASGGLVGVFPTPPPTDFTCALSMRIEGFPPGAIMQAAQLAVSTSDPNVIIYDVFFQADTQNAQLYEYENLIDGGGINSQKSLPFSILDGAWHRLTLTMHVASSPNAVMDLGGNSGATKTITPPSPITGFQFNIGIGFTNAAPNWTAYFDDAVCDAL